MKDFRSNDEFFAGLRTLIERWCDERRFARPAKVLPAYLSFNGLADGWHEMSNSLKAARALGHESFSPTDWDDLNDLVHAADLAIRSR